MHDDDNDDEKEKERERKKETVEVLVEHLPGELIFSRR